MLFTLPYTRQATYEWLKMVAKLRLINSLNLKFTCNFVCICIVRNKTHCIASRRLTDFLRRLPGVKTFPTFFRRNESTQNGYSTYRTTYIHRRRMQTKPNKELHLQSQNMDKHSMYDSGCRQYRA